MKHMPLTATLLICAAAASFAARADVSLHFVNHDGQKSLVQANNKNVRVEQNAAAEIYMLFNTAQNELTVVNSKDKKFHVITAERIEEASKKVAEAKARMIESFPNLPPEQQERLRPILDKMKAAEQRKMTTQKQGQKSVAGIPCTEFKVQTNNTQTQTLCAANAKNLGISGADYKSITGMLNMLADLSNKMGGGMMPGAISPNEVGGIPVNTTNNDANKFTKLSQIDRNRINAARFSVPTGYSRTELPR